MNLPSQFQPGDKALLNGREVVVSAVSFEASGKVRYAVEGVLVDSEELSASAEEMAGVGA